MSHFRNATFSGNVTAPEVKQVGQNTVKEFTLFAQDRRKDRDTGEYREFEPGEPVRVSLWREAADIDIQKGDLVEVTGSFHVRRYVKNDGTPGFGLETEFVDSAVVKFRKEGGSASGGGSSSPFADNSPF